MQHQVPRRQLRMYKPLRSSAIVGQHDLGEQQRLLACFLQRNLAPRGDHRGGNLDILPRARPAEHGRVVDNQVPKHRRKEPIRVVNLHRLQLRHLARRAPRRQENAVDLVRERVRREARRGEGQPAQVRPVRERGVGGEACCCCFGGGGETAGPGHKGLEKVVCVGDVRGAEFFKVQAVAAKAVREEGKALVALRVCRLEGVEGAKVLKDAEPFDGG